MTKRRGYVKIDVNIIVWREKIMINILSESGYTAAPATGDVGTIFLVVFAAAALVLFIFVLKRRKK